MYIPSFLHRPKHRPLPTFAYIHTYTHAHLGYNLGIPLNPADIRDFEALCPTGPWLFPRPCLWGPDEVGGFVWIIAHDREGLAMHVTPPRNTQDLHPHT